MPAIKKNTKQRSAAKKAGTKPVIITKSASAGTSAFSKKVKTMNALLEKAKLLT